VPLTEHTPGVSELKLTLSPELALALTVIVTARMVCRGSWPKVMVCGVL
jgi:hypothetical protein